MRALSPMAIAIVACGFLAAIPARGGAPPGRYQITTNGTVDDTTDDTVLDVATNLRWQRATSGPVTWDAKASAGSAQAYCASLSVGTFTSGWRLPQIRELVTLVDPRRVRPAFDLVAFPGLVISPETGATHKFWSATPFAGSTSQVWVLGAGTGRVGTWNMVNNPLEIARCVRAP